MKTNKVKGLDITLGKSNAFAYETPPDLPKAHQSMLFVGKRGSGKTLGLVNLLEKMNYDRIFMISPSVLSNKEMMDRLHLDPDDIYDDVDDITCIEKIILKVEQERNDLEEYREKLKLWNKLQGMFNGNKLLGDCEDEVLLTLYNPLSRSFDKPTHKYDGRPPMLGLVFDDVVGSMLFTKGIRKLNKLTIYHRHIAPFKEGGALGVSLYFLVQTYKAQAGGISKCIRNNTTSLVLFRTKNESELKDIQQECSGEVAEETFNEFYNYATSDPHGFLFIDFHKKPNHVSGFRKYWSEFLIPDEIKEQLTSKENISKVKDAE